RPPLALSASPTRRSSDLSIFRDDGRSWRVQNGHIVESSAGWQTAGVLFTHKRFSNYRLRLEYKLDPGARWHFVPRFREEDNLLRSEEHTSELQSRGHLVC